MGHVSGKAANHAKLRTAFCAAVAGLALGPLPACNFAFYHPSRQVLAAPARPKQDVWFEASDGVRLHGWLFRTARAPARGIVIQMHGNAANLTSHHRSLVWLVDHGYDFLAFDYRGYGRSGGSPSRDGIARDALAAIRFASEASRAPDRTHDLVIVGQSLGGAVAVHAVAQLGVDQRRRVSTVVLEGTFHSYSDIAGGVLWRTGVLAPLSGMGYGLVSDDNAPWKVIDQLSPIPVLVVHDVGDPVIPFEYGAALYRAARPPKRFWALDRGEHIRAFRRESTREALVAYLEACREPHGKQ